MGGTQREQTPWALPRYGIPRSVPSSGPAGLIAGPRVERLSTCSDKTRLWRSSALSPNTLTFKGKGSPILKQLWTSTSCDCTVPGKAVSALKMITLEEDSLDFGISANGPPHKGNLTNRYSSCESICRAIRAILWSILSSSECRDYYLSPMARISDSLPYR